MPLPDNAEEIIETWFQEIKNKKIRSREWKDQLLKMKSSAETKKAFDAKDITLADLLYYDDFKDGKIIKADPSSKDINQGGAIFSLPGDRQLKSCANCAVLMGLAQTNPNYITSTLIKPNPNKPLSEVKVHLYNAKYKFEVHNKLKEKGVCDLVITVEPDGCKDVPVTIDEIIQMCKKTYHRHLWPLVVEIALAKEMRNFTSVDSTLTAEFEDFEEIIWYSYRFEIASYYFNEMGKNDPDKLATTIFLHEGDLGPKKNDSEAEKKRENLKKLYEEVQKEFYKFRGKKENQQKLIDFVESEFDEKRGSNILFSTIVTGKKSRIRSPLDFKSCKIYEEVVEYGKRKVDNYILDEAGSRNIGKFTSREGKQDQYGQREITLFNRIEKKLKEKQVVTVGFSKKILIDSAKHKVDEDIINDTTEYVLSKFKPKLDPKTKELYIEDRLSDEPNGIVKRPTEFAKDTILDWAKDRFDAAEKSTTRGKIKKRGIMGNHAYVVKAAISISAGKEVTIIEKPVYKFIVIENPHDMDTYVDYSKDSKRLSNTAKQFLEKNEQFKEQKELYINNRRTCIMELNHFSKLLRSIIYTRDPKS